MKTAVSIPDPLFNTGEKIAKRLKLSRSALYAQALEEFFRRRDEQALIDQINEACRKEDTRLEPGLMRAQMQALPPDEAW